MNCIYLIFLRFVVGPSEENGYSIPSLSTQSSQLSNFSNQSTIKQAISDIRQAYCDLDGKLKKIWVNDVCPHGYGCLHYIISVRNKLLKKKHFYSFK